MGKDSQVHLRGIVNPSALAPHRMRHMGLGWNGSFVFMTTAVGEEHKCA